MNTDIENAVKLLEKNGYKIINPENWAKFKCLTDDNSWQQFVGKLFLIKTSIQNIEETLIKVNEIKSLK